MTLSQDKLIVLVRAMVIGMRSLGCIQVFWAYVRRGSSVQHAAELTFLGEVFHSAELGLKMVNIDARVEDTQSYHPHHLRYVPFTRGDEL